MTADRAQPSEPLTVWATGQRPHRLQRSGRYLPATAAHPARMLPAIAAQAIAAFTEPGEWVLDPMCGIGTTITEAIHAGRHAVGIEYEPRWAALSAAGVTHARSQGATGEASVIRGDARALTTLVPYALVGKVALVLTSPPYGGHVHGHVRSVQGRVAKRNHRYSRNRANLAHRSLDELFAAFTEILIGCAEVLRPGGIVAVTARPIRRHGELTDLPGRVINAGLVVGLEPIGRVAALLCGLRDDHLVTRASFFAMHETRRLRTSGLPVHVIAHEDLLIFRRLNIPSSSRELKGVARQFCHRGPLNTGELGAAA